MKNIFKNWFKKPEEKQAEADKKYSFLSEEDILNISTYFGFEFKTTDSFISPQDGRNYFYVSKETFNSIVNYICKEFLRSLKPIEGTKHYIIADGHHSTIMNLPDKFIREIMPRISSTNLFGCTTNYFLSYVEYLNYLERERINKQIEEKLGVTIEQLRRALE